MPDLALTTWNVLHRVHAENWDEVSVEAFPDERVRIARISETARQWLRDGVSVICLQEVSGDQLASLRACVGSGVSVFHHCYPRMPRPKRLERPGAPRLDDPSEHLVVLTSDPRARVTACETFASDPGKGFLAVSALGARVIATHVTHGARGREQIATLAAFAREGAEPTVLVGDFNANADDVRACLGAGFVVADLAGQRPTRCATPSSEAHTIDHIAALGGELTSASVLDGEGLSDHNPVSARFVVS